jgi:hypothetical protein
LDHYLDVPMKKPGALAGSTALEQCRAPGRWPASYDQFWEVLRQRQGKQEGTRARIGVLLLAREHGPAPVRRAVEEALEVGCSDVHAVRYLLNVSGQEPPPPAARVHIGALNRYDRPQPSLEDYERLRPNWPRAGRVRQISALTSTNSLWRLCSFRNSAISLSALRTAA